MGRGGKLKQYARAMRHRFVQKCAIGGFGFYLLLRFHISREMEPENRPDFTENKTWFNWKVLTDGTLNNEKMMSKKSYTDAIRKVFRELKIVTSHYGHWGRVSAPVELELNKLDPEQIRLLGKLVCVCDLVDCCFKKSSNIFSLQVIGIPKPKMLDTRARCR